MHGKLRQPLLRFTRLSDGFAGPLPAASSCSHRLRQFPLPSEPYSRGLRSGSAHRCPTPSLGLIGSFWGLTQLLWAIALRTWENACFRPPLQKVCCSVSPSRFALRRLSLQRSLLMRSCLVPRSRAPRSPGSSNVFLSHSYGSPEQPGRSRLRSLSSVPCCPGKGHHPGCSG